MRFLGPGWRAAHQPERRSKHSGRTAPAGSEAAFTRGVPEAWSKLGMEC